MWGLQGLQEITLDHGYIFHGEETTPGSVQVVGKISGENHPFVEHFKFVKQFEDDNTVARQTIPAPAQLYAELFREDNGKATRAVYPDDDALLSDIAAAYRQVIADLYAAGCRNVQLDDCTWGMFCDAGYQQFLASTGAKLEDEAEKYLQLNMCAGAIITPPGPAPAAMRLLHPFCLLRNMWTAFIWSLMTPVPAILHRCSLLPRAKKWCWAW